MDMGHSSKKTRAPTAALQGLELITQRQWPIRLTDISLPMMDLFFSAERRGEPQPQACQFAKGVR
jgi:hypothetical protein